MTGGAKAPRSFTYKTQVFCKSSISTLMELNSTGIKFRALTVPYF